MSDFAADAGVVMEDVLATRVLSYPIDNGTNEELILTVFKPFEAKEYQWKCGFVFGPPICQEVMYGAGIDFIQAFVNDLIYARAYLGTWSLGRRVHWEGMLDYGLPEFAKEPASLGPEDIPPPSKGAEAMDILTTRAVGYRDRSGIQKEFLLTIFAPFKAEKEVWKCGFVFDSPPSTIRYGAGADFIEALLDGLAKARATFEGMASKDWSPPEEIFDCADFPYRVGRSFWTDPAPELPPEESDQLME